MRWDNLFDDLEGQLESELTAEEVELRAEEERLRLARLSLRDRILAVQVEGDDASAVPLRLLLGGERMLDVRPLNFGRDWFSAEIVEQTGRRSQCIVPLAAVHGLVLNRRQVDLSLRVANATSGASGAPRPSAALSDRLGLGFVLRDLCRRRRAIELRLLSGAALHGTVDRVGRDHIDVALHEPGSPRREREVTQYRVVPLVAIELVRFTVQ